MGVRSERQWTYIAVTAWTCAGKSNDNSLVEPLNGNACDVDFLSLDEAARPSRQDFCVFGSCRQTWTFFELQTACNFFLGYDHATSFPSHTHSFLTIDVYQQNERRRRPAAGQ